MRIEDSQAFRMVSKTTQELYLRLLDACDEYRAVLNAREIRERMGATDLDVKNLLLQEWVKVEEGIVFVNRETWHDALIQWKEGKVIVWDGKLIRIES